MKKTHDFPGYRVSARNVRPLMPVAMKTCQREIIKIGCALMLSCDYVVHLKRKTVVGRRDEAILAPVPGAAA
jgi:hypothetical protein